MNASRTDYTTSNEDLLLVEVLGNMYDDNLRQIERMNTAVDNVMADNIRIRNLLVQILRTHRVNTTTTPRTTTTFSRTAPAVHRTNTAVPRTPPRTSTAVPRIPAMLPRTRNATPISTTASLANNLGRLFVNDTPYIIDSFQHYTFPTGSGMPPNIFSDTIRNFYEPVHIFPTQIQIEIATRRVRYGDIQIPRNRSCPISMAEFNDADIVTMIHQCGHIFHTNEINTWFSRHCTCPICRFDIRESGNTANTTNTANTANTTNTTNTTNASEATENDDDDDDDDDEVPDIIEDRNEARSSIQSAENALQENASQLATNIVDNLLNTFNIRNIDVILTDLSNNNISNSDPYTLFNLMSRFNTRNNQ